MAVYRNSLLMAITTNPANKVSASPHSGGWSESFWLNGSTFLPAGWQKWAAVRAAMLPSTASVIGFRVQTYTIAGNKLLPGGSSVGKLNVPGTTLYTSDLPQCALELSFSLAGATNSIRSRLASIPDEQISQGEYQPTGPFMAAVQAYIAFVVGTGGGQPFAGVVRNLSLASARVFSLAGTTLTIAPGSTLNAPGQYVRFHRVYDDNGNPVKGSYLVTAAVVGANNTVLTLAQNLGQTITKPNGLVREDLLTVQNINAGTVGRALVRKIGRPFASYRGRRSKQRV
jgi:hypothetical protein